MNYLVLLLAFPITIIAIGDNTAMNMPADKYKIYKIDSIKNYFLIYAQKKDSTYKIVSKKVTGIQGCPVQIELNKEYPFKLYSYLIVNGKSIIPEASINEIGGFQIDDSTIIPLDRSRNLYHPKNLQGLCLLENRPD